MMDNMVIILKHIKFNNMQFLQTNSAFSVSLKPEYNNMIMMLYAITLHHFMST